MDHKWARGQLHEFVEQCARWWSADENGSLGNVEAAIDELQRMAPMVREILRRLDPSLCAAIRPFDGDVNAARAAALEGLGWLNVLDAKDQIGPAGPILEAEELHPWVWEAAQAFWHSKHYAQAVEQAWKSINAHLQTRANRRDIADDQLVNAILSPGPPKSGITKLVVQGDATDASWLSRQRGLHLLGQAAVAGIRNVIAHEHVELAEGTALEYLALLSVLARWADETVSVTGAQGESAASGQHD